jgi:hypothetical protein
LENSTGAGAKIDQNFKFPISNRLDQRGFDLNFRDVQRSHGIPIARDLAEVIVSNFGPPTLDISEAFEVSLYLGIAHWNHALNGPSDGSALPYFGHSEKDPGSFLDSLQ